jgi:hypothetical protein
MDICSTYEKMNPNGVKNLNAPITAIQISVTGINTFQPRRIIWSYRYLGKVALNHKNKNATTESFAKNQNTPGSQLNGGKSNGEFHPPKNRITVNADIISIFAYSARKKAAKPIPE